MAQVAQVGQVAQVAQVGRVPSWGVGRHKVKGMSRVSHLSAGAICGLLSHAAMVW